MSYSPFANASPVGFRAVTTGFTAPTTIYERMRRINDDANALDHDVLANVAPGGYRSAWQAWIASWRAFFSKTLDEKVGNLFRTDELDAEVDAKQAEFLGFFKAYPDQKTSAGTAVPPPSKPAPVPVPKSKSEGGSSLPAWFWVLATVAVGGIGYLGYRHYKEAQAKRAVLEREVLPGVLGGMFGAKTGGALAKAAAARDPIMALATSKDPAALARYQAFAYRPYDHPHVVPARSPAPRRDRAPTFAEGMPVEPYRDPWSGGDDYESDFESF